MNDTECRLLPEVVWFFNGLDITESDYNILMALPTRILEEIHNYATVSSRKRTQGLIDEGISDGYDRGRDDGRDEGARDERRRIIKSLEDKGI